MTLQASFTVGTPSRAKKERLFHSDKIEIRKSPVHGYGVFAKDDIKKGELLEECYYLEVGWSEEMGRYRFDFKDNQLGQTPLDENPEKMVISLGFGSMYNTSLSGEENGSINHDLDNEIFVFKSLKDIKKDEEILLEYDLEYETEDKI